MTGDAEAVVRASAQEPDDVLPAGYHKLSFTLCGADFAVRQIVADQFAAFHAEGYEPVSVFPEPDFKWTFNKCGIKCGNRWGL